MAFKIEKRPSPEELQKRKRRWQWLLLAFLIPVGYATWLVADPRYESCPACGGSGQIRKWFPWD